MEAIRIENGPFEPTWESLRSFECPEWFHNAKLGIWSHWGPQSVPMYGDWYARGMYMEKEKRDQHRYHWRTYGHPSRFGYKDIIPLWKAEKFDPDALMDLYVASGARYFVAQANHHDNFDNWDSKHHRWNAVKMGPKKNIVRLWEDAARKRGLRFGLTEHMGITFRWWKVNKGADTKGPYAGVPYDGNDPEYEDLYLPNRDEKEERGYTDNAWFHQRWFERMKDVIDQHQPDLFYSDNGSLPFYRPDMGVYCAEPGLNIVAHLYNTSAKNHNGVNEAVYNQKNKDPDVYKIGVLDLERHMQPDIFPDPWQTDTCVGGWFYDVRREYKSPRQVIEMLVDIVSKNGNLLLNFPQRPDGTLDEECLYILDCMAKWISVNGEGIYETRPWKVAGENMAVPEEGRVREKEFDYNVNEFRFTARNNTVYAFVMKWPDDLNVFIRSFAKKDGLDVADVNLLGCEKPVKWEQKEEGLAVSLPEQKPAEYAQCLRIEQSD